MLLLAIFMPFVSHLKFKKDLELSTINESKHNSAEIAVKKRLTRAVRDQNEPVVIEGQYLSLLMKQTRKYLQKDSLVRSLLSFFKKKRAL